MASVSERDLRPHPWFPQEASICDGNNLLIESFHLVGQSASLSPLRPMLLTFSLGSLGAYAGTQEYSIIGSPEAGTNMQLG